MMMGKLKPKSVADHEAEIDTLVKQVKHGLHTPSIVHGSDANVGYLGDRAKRYFALEARLRQLIKALPPAGTTTRGELAVFADKVIEVVSRLGGAR